LTELQQVENRLARLIEDLAGSLQREIEGLRSEMRNGFDRIEASTKRNTGMIVSGTIAVSTLKKWTVKADERDKRREAEIRDLRSRLQKVERAVLRRKST
jgi:hypothetical protein